MDKNEAKLKRLLSLMDEDSLTKEDFIKNFEVVLEFAKKTREFTESEVENLKYTIESILGDIKETNTTEFTLLKSQLTKRIGTEISKFNEDTVKKWERIQERIDSVRDGVDADENVIVDKVLGKIKLPEYKETVLDTPEQLRDKLEVLEGDERLDKSAIKGLDEAFDSVMQSIPRNGGGSGGVEVFNSTGKVGSGSALKFVGSGVSSVSSDGHTSTITLDGGSSLTVQDIDGTPTVTNVTAIKFTNGSVADNGDGTVNVTTGAGGGGDVSSNTATSVDSEVALFSGVGGKTIKRSTLTATVVGASSGVLSSATTTGSGSTVALSTSPDLTTPDINAATADSLQAGTTSAGLVLKNNAGTTVASFGVGSSSSTNIALIGATTVTGNISATNLSGTNTGDQTSIVGITGTKAQFDTAVTDGNILYVGDVTQYTDELAQDAVGGMSANSTFVNLTYNDATPSLTPSLSATGTPSSSTFLRGDNTWATPAGSGDVSKVGTPVNNQVGVWTGDGTLEGDTALTFDTTTDTLTTGVLNATGLTASQLTATDASKNIVSLSTATYPSLTELSYVKGVTSAIQTQLGTKQATITFGTGVQTALGVNVGSAGAPVLFNGALGTPSSGTLTNATGLPVSGITASTVTALGVGSVELGHASDTSITRVSAGRIAVEGVNVVTISSTDTLTNKTLTSPTLTTPVLGTPSSGTLTNCTGLPVAGITSSTSTALGVGSLELGHASDTTLSRSSAGVLAVEGVVVPTISSTSTITNKRIQPRTSSSTTSATLTPDVSSASVYYRTTQTEALTIGAPTGTPVIGETIMIYVDSAGAQTLTINSTYKAFGAAFPASTTAGKTFMMSAQYNGTDWKTLWANAV